MRNNYLERQRSRNQHEKHKEIVSQAVEDLAIKINNHQTQRQRLSNSLGTSAPGVRRTVKLFFFPVIIFFSYVVAKVVVYLVDEIINPQNESIFYSTILAATVGGFIVFIKDTIVATTDFLHSKSVSWKVVLPFAGPIFVLFFAVILMGQAVNRVVDKVDYPPVNFLIGSTVTPVVRANDGFFQFYVFFSDISGNGKGGWKSLASPTHGSVSITANVFQKFISNISTLLDQCATPSNPVEIDVYGFFSSSLWLDDNKEPVTIDYLNKNFPATLNDVKEHLFYSKSIENIHEKQQRGGYKNAAKAFNLWLAEERAIGVCYAIARSVKKKIKRTELGRCEQIIVGNLIIRNRVLGATYKELAAMLNRIDPQLSSDTDDKSDYRVFSRSAVAKIKRVGRCEVPITTSPLVFEDTKIDLENKV